MPNADAPMHFRTPTSRPQGRARDAVHVHLMPMPAGRGVDWSLRPELDVSERARVQRLRRPADQQLFAGAHVLLRWALSHHAAADPSDWRFETARDGKPALCHRHHPMLQHLRFNLSHCAGLVAVAVTLDREVGVDVEEVDAMRDQVGMADMILTSDERALWSRIVPVDPGEPTDLARRRFLLERWTLKEAALKAMGIGLGGVEPNQFSLVHGPEAGWQLQAFEGDPQPDRRWFLATGPAGPAHGLAVACERRPGERAPAVVLTQWQMPGPSPVPVCIHL